MEKALLLFKRYMRNGRVLAGSAASSVTAYTNPQDRTSESEQFKSALHAVLRAGQRCFDEKRWPAHVLSTFREYELATRHLIAEMSSVARPARHAEKAEFDLRDCLQDTCSKHRQIAAAKGLNFLLRIAGSLPNKVVGDAGRLRRVVDALFSRAISCTESGTVRCEVTHLVEQGKRPHRVMIRMRDTGSGFDYNDSRVLFDSDGDDADVIAKPGVREILDLKKIVEEMGGDVAVFSQRSFGTTITINLWFGSAAGADLVELSGSVDLVGVRILLVDKPGASRELFAAQLQTIGVSLSLADDGVFALQSVLRAIMAGKPYDMLITDLGAEFVNGLELARYLRRRGLLDDLCLVATTEHGMQGDAELCRNAGFAAYLVKPLPPDQIGNLLRAGLAMLMLSEQERNAKGLITRHHAREFEKAEGQVVYFGTDPSTLEAHPSVQDVTVKFARSVDGVVAEVTRAATRLIVVDRPVTPGGVRRGLDVMRKVLGDERVPPVVLVGEFSARERVEFRRVGVRNFSRTWSEAIATV